MNVRHRPLVRHPARTRRTHLAAAVVMALLVVACGSTPPNPAVTSAPTATSGAPPTVDRSPSPSPSAGYADTLRIGNHLGRAVQMSNQSFGAQRLGAADLTLGALYRFTAKYDAVPDLADGPCLPQGDGSVIRCKLIATTFQDGSPLTADDVAYTFRLRQRPTCGGSASCLGVADVTPTFRDVHVVDDRTVEFVLSRADPTFLTTTLPGIAIEPRHVIEASFARFLADAKGLDPKTLVVMADTIDDETGRDPPVCTKRIDDTKKLLGRLHIPWFSEDFQVDQGFDPCGFSGFGAYVARQVATALQSSGLDAVEAAYPLLSFNWQPVGTGPYRFVSQTADATVLEASPTYHGGPAATRTVRLIPSGGDGLEIVAGKVDIDADLDVPDLAAIEAATGLVLVQTPQPSLTALHYNVRAGHPFADRNLRLALQSCVDLRRTVDAATGDASLLVESPFMPGGWAFDSDLPVPPRDISHAESLIEASGWRRGPDGVYAKDGHPLSAQIVVRGDVAQRAKAADLIAAQARDCGMDITSRPVRFGQDIGEMIGNYPHDIPGTKKPFDLYLGGWNNWPDPGLGTNLFDSRQMTSPAHPDGSQYGLLGFADPVVDRLIDAGLATYDQAARAVAYRSLQEEIAAQQPILTLWSHRGTSIIRSSVLSTGEPLDVTAPFWSWQPEKLVVLRDGP